MGDMDKSPSTVTKEAAKKLKGVITPPDWAAYVKTGAHKERPPQQDDWWYLRAASILRKINDLGPIGVQKLRVKYGGKKNRGVMPERFTKGSGHIARTILQQLEGAELVKKENKGIHKGRIITKKGKDLLNNKSSQ